MTDPSAAAGVPQPEIVCTVRVRMGQEDAHYGGNLVDGARPLKLFGDVITEIAIITDGDEGLFVGYEKIEFLAPGHAGGFLEVTGGVRAFAEADLPPGEVEIRILWSSVNYKDGLATTANGRVARISPLIPGIDLAGEVVASADPGIAVGSQVLAHGYELGVSRHGGFAEYQRVPAGWGGPPPAGGSPREARGGGA